MTSLKSKMFSDEIAWLYIIVQIVGGQGNWPLGQLKICFESIHFDNFYLYKHQFVINTGIRHTKHCSTLWGSLFLYHPVVVVHTCNILPYCLSTLTIDQLTSMLQTLYKDVFPTFRFRCCWLVNRHVPLYVE